MVDTQRSERCSRKGVEVQLLSSAPVCPIIMKEGSVRIGAQIVEAHDDSGLGVASSRVAQSILINMGHIPLMWHTEILSNTTDYPLPPCSLDTTEHMVLTLNLWQELGVVADGIQTGWLGNPKQIPLIRKMSEVLTHNGTVILIDPVMGDGFGEGSVIYSRPGIVEEISNLVRVADIITPNPTEAAILLGKEPKECGVGDNGMVNVGLAKDLTAALALVYPGLVILKSVIDERKPDSIGTCIRFTGDNAVGIGLHPTTRVVFTERVGSGTGGTGDAFATLVMGQWLRQAMGKRGDQDSVCGIIERSMGIISDSLRAIQNEEGLKFLPALARQVNRVFWS